MSERLKLAIRRQQDVQKSRDIAWMAFAALVPIILVAALGLLLPLVSAEPRLSLGQLISGVVAIFAAGIAYQVFREARQVVARSADADESGKRQRRDARSALVRAESLLGMAQLAIAGPHIDPGNPA